VERLRFRRVAASDEPQLDVIGAATHVEYAAAEFRTVLPSRKTSDKPTSRRGFGHADDAQTLAGLTDLDRYALPREAVNDVERQKPTASGSSGARGPFSREQEPSF
jgi:hypothetical protein